MMNMELLKKLCMAIGVSGEEDAVRDIILAEARQYADSVEVTPLGKSICPGSPVTTILEPKPRRVKNIFICSLVVF